MTNDSVIISIILIVIILGIFMLYKTGIFRRQVTVTIIENLPPWIFKKGRREEYSKNCELKSHKNEEVESEDKNKADTPNDDSYNKDEVHKDIDDSGIRLVEECSEDSEKLEKENSFVEDYKEQSKDEILIKESVELHLESSQIEDSDELENVEVSNEKEAEEGKKINENSHEHKPKFITNSLSMLKDYEKLLDKLNNDSVNESNVLLTDEYKEVSENNSESLEIEESMTISENCKVKQEEEHEAECKELVYWTTSGKTYHKSKTCTALSRSKVIHSGTIAESGKLSLCSKCR